VWGEHFLYGFLNPEGNEEGDLVKKKKILLRISRDWEHFQKGRMLN
jgi:hypothetical protein